MASATPASRRVALDEAADERRLRKDANMSPAEFAAQGSEPVASRAGRIELGGEVSANRLGFGAMRLPGVWEAPQDPQLARRLLRRAIELGVNLIDTAHAYGPETSERLIAEALRPYPPELIVATKSGYGPAAPTGGRRMAAPRRSDTTASAAWKTSASGSAWSAISVSSCAQPWLSKESGISSTKARSAAGASRHRAVRRTPQLACSFLRHAGLSVA